MIVVLPTETWTQRYLQLGCGGLCGRLSIVEVGAASGCQTLQAGGFAVAATDMGHQGMDPSWGSDPQKRADFAHRANHLTALAAKTLIEAFYGHRQRSQPLGLRWNRFAIAEGRLDEVRRREPR